MKKRRMKALVMLALGIIIVFRERVIVIGQSPQVHLTQNAK